MLAVFSMRRQIIPVLYLAVVCCNEAGGLFVSK